MKIHTKIALLFAVLSAGIVLAVSVFLYYQTNQSIFEDFYKRLEIRAVVVAKAAFNKDGALSEAYSNLRAQHLEALPGEREYILPIAKDGSLPASGQPYTLPAPALRRALLEGNSTARGGNTFYYFLLHQGAAGQRHVVVISAVSEMGLQYLSYLRRAMLVAFVAAMLLAFTVGMWFSKSILKPIRGITARVRSLSADNLHLRLANRPGTDELAELSATFNNMLDRLETAFETQNNFVSHASHELNTPLTSIIGEAEYALARPRTPEQYTESISNMHAAAGKLSAITRSLLNLAQTGLTGKVQEMERLRVDELIRNVQRMTNDIMPGNQLIINTSLTPASESKLTVYGNRALLELALTNIVLNACKYSDNKPVQLALAATNDRLILVVKDEGIGIPEDEVRFVFDPFFRASNTGAFKGYGIGLPLTRNILRIHKGELIIRSEVQQGTEIEIVLPLG